MILPTKRISEHRALLAVGGDIIRLLNSPKTVSRLWNQFKKTRADLPEAEAISFDWFVLALDLLYVLGVVETQVGRVRKVET